MARYKCAGVFRKQEDGSPVCSYEADARWLGACPSCGRFYNVTTRGEDKATESASLASLSKRAPPKRISSGIPQLDRVLGGGIVKGQQILITGPPGVGKSTLLLQMVEAITTQTGRPALYTSGEQSTDDIALFAERLQLKAELVEVLGNECEVYKIVERAEEVKPIVLVIDSINTAVTDDAGGDVGSNEQMLAASKYLTSFGKTTGTICIYVIQILKNDDMSGPKTLEHLVDTILNFDPAPSYDDDGQVLEWSQHHRELASGKNRFGPEKLTEVLEMTEKGLQPPARSSRIHSASG